MKNKYNDFFRDITPSAELEERTLRQMKSAAVRTRKRSRKRILAVTAAVCAALICGVSVAAANGLFVFETLFGRYVHVEDSELADSLLGTVSDVKYRVSDDDYQIAVKGAAGTDNSIMAVAEISRVDGTPVTEHFLQPLAEENENILYHEVKIAPIGGGMWVSGYGASVNSSGNIEIRFDVSAQNPLSGNIIEASGKDFYPFSASPSFGKTDVNSLILLDLEWELSFRYAPSDTAAAVKKCVSPVETFKFYEKVSRFIVAKDEINEDGIVSRSVYNDESSAIIIENTARLISVEVSALGGRLIFEYDGNEYVKVNSSEYDVRLAENEIYLIKADGTTVPVHTICTGFSGGDVYRYDIEFCYNEENDYMVSPQMAVETNEVTAISINGTVYALE